MSVGFGALDTLSGYLEYGPEVHIEIIQNGFTGPFGVLGVKGFGPDTFRLLWFHGRYGIKSRAALRKPASPLLLLLELLRTRRLLPLLAAADDAPTPATATTTATPTPTLTLTPYTATTTTTTTTTTPPHATYAGGGCNRRQDLKLRCTGTGFALWVPAVQLTGINLFFNKEGRLGTVSST